MCPLKFLVRRSEALTRGSRRFHAFPTISAPWVSIRSLTSKRVELASSAATMSSVILDSEAGSSFDADLLESADGSGDPEFAKGISCVRWIGCCLEKLEAIVHCQERSSFQEFLNFRHQNCQNETVVDM